MILRIFFIIILSAIFIGFFYVGSEFYRPLDPMGKERPFLVNKGDNFLTIAKNLEKEALVRNHFYFSLYSFSKRKHKDLKAGEYLLSPAMSIVEIAEKIINGQTNKIKITIPEGWTKEDIAELLEGKNLSNKEEFLSAVSRPESFYERFGFLRKNPQLKDLEGYLFPDSYIFERPISPEEIISVFLKNFEKKVTSGMLVEIDRQDKKLSEIIIVASLIEKEVILKSDKEIVSGILWKRLSIGMPLQIDATITYLTKRKSIAITMEELKTDSPYNTYKYAGLPPGPISNPGIESILAAIYPKKTSYLFYLSSKTGETIFSENAKDHSIARERHLK